MEIRLNIDDRFFMKLVEALREKRPDVIAGWAFNLLDWAVEERKNGRFVLSARQDGSDVKRLEMPALARVSESKSAKPIIADAGQFKITSSSS